MDGSQKLLIDIEGQNGVMGYGTLSYYTKSKVEVVLSGKNIVPVSENERNLNIYKLLENNCNVIFCTTEKLDDFQFYPVPCFWIFAVDDEGNSFGTIGGIGDITDDDYPVGYVNQEGMCGKIADNLKEFLELITFYPNWREIIRYEQIQINYDRNDMEMKQKEYDLQYFENQREIAETLKLSKNPQSIELLISNIKSISGFVVYSSKNEAQMTNTFWDMHSLD
ncbi:hypothetical protein Amet_2249 [Alkaliphilus metalliredigens QYMF]|uniref:Uncharacterized protein n=1 Tax=Alkaliphilus metalliredigens (strain QYMF) TaxID=293826 RepID=A6TQD9_ALKMQ|nr:hypothetical protein [Alkaliphilus metalliredigens]ABR48407.1 hypothetical protein Amet_2249 [Alkaliphilus metalliredigens QYMF]